MFNAIILSIHAQLVAKGGITVVATFNYQVIPELKTTACIDKSQLQVKNCIGIYHQWVDNTLELYVWYAWRGWCGWWVSLGTCSIVILYRAFCTEDGTVHE